MKVSLIIPTLNEEKILPLQAACLRDFGGELEIIVADGLSSDRTQELARQYGWRIVASERGRGTQMNAGAAVATGEVLVFLHADTMLPARASAMISELLRDSRVVGGNFRLEFSGDRWESRWLTRLYPVLRLGGLCYGDSGFFLRREFFERVGGYREYPLFEDCDMYRRVSRLGRFVRVDGVATTSSRRFEGRFIRTFMLWIVLQVLYWCGVSPERLAVYYRIFR
jgi:rSAM/selenodomain-associated transferase 2